MSIQRIPKFTYLRSALLLGLFLLTSWSQAAGHRVLVIGDSISAAYGMDLEQGWVALWTDSLDDSAEVINASISGETTSGGLTRLPNLLDRYQPILVVIELGGNDGLRGYPLPRMRANLEQMIQLSIEAGAQVALIPMQIPPNYGPAYTRQFSAVYSALAEQYDAVLTPFFLADVALKSDLMQSDGIHPTADAQPIMLNALRDALTHALERAKDTSL
jgi:acyl-CoA thioesterase-1